MKLISKMPMFVISRHSDGTGETLALRNNVVSRKKLIGIANFIKVNSEAAALSTGTQLLSTEQEIRDTKTAQVLMPLLSGILDVKEVLKQAKAGGIQLTEVELNEFIVKLANEKITAPQIHRPRDEETISANGLFDRYKGGFQLTAVVAKDRAYYENIIYSVRNGVPIAKGAIAANDPKLKGKIVEAVEFKGTTEAEIKTSAITFGNQIRTERNALKKYKDRLIQNKWTNADFAIVLSPDAELVLQNDVRYNMYDKSVMDKAGVFDGNFDGTPFIVSKQIPDGVDFMIMLKGAATSVFMLRNKMNADKVIGVDAYAVSLEFDEGTGVWMPHMITIGFKKGTAGFVAQDQQGYEKLLLQMNKSETTSGNAANSDGLGLPFIATKQELAKLDEAQLDAIGVLKGVDLSGAADKDAKVDTLAEELGLAEIQ